jgi:cyanophycin synthetase
MAHVLEHVILEMQYMLGYDVSFGKTRMIEDPSLYYLVFAYQNEVCGLECGKAAIFILNSILERKEVKMDEFIEYLQKGSLEAELVPSTSAIVREAQKQGIPVTRIGNESLVRLGYGRYSRLIESTLTDSTSCISADISCNKQLTKYILSEHMIPVPYGKVVYSEISAQMVACQIGMPVVIKPFDGNQGKGVHLNITGKKAVRDAFRDASSYSGGVIVERYIEGSDYRLLVVGGKVRAAARRLPASVTGDGIHAIRELVDIVNSDPQRGENHEKPMTKIRLDKIAVALLNKEGLTPDTVLPSGRTVRLRENGNMSTGGTAIDCTDLVHPENAEYAVRAACALGIDIAGVDIVTSDISQSIRDTGGAVVEVNTAPGIRMHLFPAGGTPRNVAKDIVDHLFPDERSKRFPIVSVTGTNGKTTVVRLIAHVLACSGLSVGMTSTSGTFINGECICRGDNSGPRSARALLSNKKIDAAVLEAARGGIVREGLGYDLADVGVITNVTEDHLGADGIETLDDLIMAKSLVVEAVRENGYAVLNAEDPSTASIIGRVKAKPILFAKDPQSINRYGGLECDRVFLQNGIVTVTGGSGTIEMTDISDVPITCEGRISCNVENMLAAVSALYALGVSPDCIRSGLRSFSRNTGRFELYAYNGAFVMLDYGHNPAGYSSVLKTCEELICDRLIGVIAMPGDRSDQTIMSVGSLCANAFDRIYIKEDVDLRGRKEGETAGLLYLAIMAEGIDKHRVMIMDNEINALNQALNDSLPGDLIVLFYEKYEPLKDMLLGLGAVKIPLSRLTVKNDRQVSVHQKRE